MNHSADLSPPLIEDIEGLVAIALNEDVGSGDITAELIPSDQNSYAEVVCRETAVLAGQPWFDSVFASLDSTIFVEWRYRDGEELAPGDIVCRVRGPTRGIVTGERTALNFLQFLSATATSTHHYANALTGSKTRILDTRKTLPGLRVAQKYAVRCGKGENHRTGLFDAVLIKENHIAAAGSITTAVETIRALHPEIHIEVEVENMSELTEALKAGADMIMLDNFPSEKLATAIEKVDGRAVVEISGNINLENLSDLRSTGADFISIGSLTKNIRAIDFSMRVTPIIEQRD